MAVERVREGRKLPRAHVASEKKDTFAARLSGGEVFFSVNLDDAADILRRVTRKLRKLTRHPANLADHSVHRRAALFVRPVWICKLKVEHRGVAERRAEGVGCGREVRTDEARGASRQNPQSFQAHPGRGKLQPFPHRVPLCASVGTRASPPGRLLRVAWVLRGTIAPRRC